MPESRERVRLTPTAMTLEEALLKLAETDHTLAFTDDENEPWVVVEKLEVDIATPYCRSWAEAVSHVWGYPVVERDPTAELVAASRRTVSGPKPYPEWVEEAVRDHYDRIAEGTEDKPHVGIADMLWDAYERGQRDAAPRLAAALKEIAEWPNGGNRYGQQNIKEFARAALREAGES